MTNSYRETLEEHAFAAGYTPAAHPASGRKGLNASMLLLIAVLAALTFYGLAIAVLSGTSTGFDNAVLRELHQYAPAHLKHFSNLVCMLVTCGSVFGLAYLLWQRQWRSALFWFGATAGASILAGVAKKAVERHRPELWALASPHASFSFPSGHATQAMAFVLALLALAPTAKRTAILACGAAWIVLVGVCRLYLGLHYPTDILAGWALALAWCSLLALLARQPRSATR
jgi:undecaprenyl-diphosphatase